MPKMQTDKRNVWSLRRPGLRPTNRGKHVGRHPGNGLGLDSSASELQTLDEVVHLNKSQFPQLGHSLQHRHHSV